MILFNSQSSTIFSQPCYSREVSMRLISSATLAEQSGYFIVATNPANELNISKHRKHNSNWKFDLDLIDMT